MLFKISNSFFYTQKVAYFVFTDSSSPVKASSFNPLSPDLLTLYRRPNPIKIWPTYAVPPTTADPSIFPERGRAGSLLALCCERGFSTTSTEKRIIFEHCNAKKRRFNLKYIEHG